MFPAKEKVLMGKMQVEKQQVFVLMLKTVIVYPENLTLGFFSRLILNSIEDFSLEAQLFNVSTFKDADSEE